MENWDAQMMLDLYIHNYLIRSNRHTTAEIFAREANFYPKPVAIDTPEGFLSEWWSLFWSVFSARYPEAIGDSSSENAGNVPHYGHPALSPIPDVNCILQNMYATMPTPALPSPLQTFSPTIMPRPNIGSLLQSNVPAMMPTPGWRLPVSNFGMTQGQTIRNSTARELHEQEALRLAVRDLNSNSQLLSADQLARMLPSLNNSSLQQENVYRNPQLRFNGGDQCSTSLWRSMAAEPTRHLPKPFDLRVNHADIDSRMHMQDRLGLPVIRNLNSNSHPNSHIPHIDQLARLLPSSSACCHFQENVHKKPILSINGDDKCGTSLKISTSSEPARLLPKAFQIKVEPADTDARMGEQERVGLHFRNLNFNSQLPDVDQLARLLPSSSNSSSPQKNKKRQLSVIGKGDERGTSLKKCTAAEATHHAPKILQPKMEPADTAAGIFEQGHPDTDQSAHMLSSSSNCSHSQNNVDKESKLSVTRDDGCGTSLSTSTATEPTREAPKAMQPIKEHCDTGSSSSSNYTGCDSSS